MKNVRGNKNVENAFKKTNKTRIDIYECGNFYNYQSPKRCDVRNMYRPRPTGMNECDVIMLI